MASFELVPLIISDRHRRIGAGGLVFSRFTALQITSLRDALPVCAAATPTPTPLYGRLSLQMPMPIASLQPGRSKHPMGQEAQSTQWAGLRLGLPPACAAASRRSSWPSHGTHGSADIEAAQSTHRGAKLTFHKPASTCKVMPWLIYLPHSPHANVLCQRHARYTYEDSYRNTYAKGSATLCCIARPDAAPCLATPIVLSLPLRPQLQTKPLVLCD
ncbi:hypothetical protein CCMA1212_002489 [Trichoderma ghanense]|uniref:Uncharacterized protein n=1 Tax=Trichoderma ghanense TaxID=65468 RepID=A0ABY2HEY1_9HYPO